MVDEPDLTNSPSSASFARSCWPGRNSRSGCWKKTRSRIFPVTSQTPEFAAWMARVQSRTESALERLLPGPQAVPARLHQAMRYSVLGGGKRVRPLLVHAAALVSGRDPDAADLARFTGIPISYREHADLMFDLMTLAFQTDTTRVCTFVIANEGSNKPYPFIGVREGHHDLSHHGNDMEKKAKIANKEHSTLLTTVSV